MIFNGTVNLLRLLHRKLFIVIFLSIDQIVSAWLTNRNLQELLRSQLQIIQVAKNKLQKELKRLETPANERLKPAPIIKSPMQDPGQPSDNNMEQLLSLRRVIGSIHDKHYSGYFVLPKAFKYGPKRMREVYNHEMSCGKCVESSHTVL